MSAGLVGERAEVQMDLLGGSVENEPILEFSGAHRWMSNFHPSRLAYDGIEYATVEHAYQAAKTLSVDERRAIASLATPALAKRAGRTVTMRPDWDRVKVGVMKELLALKFQDADLRSRLMSTGDRLIVEGNRWGDRFWGQSPVGTGRNELGKLLMSLRSELRNEPRPAGRRADVPHSGLGSPGLS